MQDNENFSFEDLEPFDLFNCKGKQYPNIKVNYIAHLFMPDDVDLTWFDPEEIEYIFLN